MIDIMPAITAEAPEATKSQPALSLPAVCSAAFAAPSPATTSPAGVPAFPAQNSSTCVLPRSSIRLLHTDGTEPAAEASGPAFYTAAEIARLAPTDVAWIAKPWIAQGAMTVLDGRPKLAGKSTFLSHLVAKVLRGEEFLGKSTSRSPVVLLTEERPVTLRRVLERAGLLKAEDLVVLLQCEVAGQRWEDVVRAARDRCAQTGARLLVVDTLAAFAPGFERSPLSTSAALAPLQDAARCGLAVLVVRHERKSGGAAGDSGMGSTAMTAGVDVVMALQRPRGHTGTARMLHAVSRFEETPQSTAIQLHDGEYVRLESLDVAAEEVERALFAAAPAEPAEAKSADEIMFATGLKKTTARDALDRLCAKGSLVRLGSGVKGSPFRFHRPPLAVAA